LDFSTRFEKNLVYFIRKHDLIKANEKVLVAVSGGRDSMALLHALSKVKKDFSISIVAVHMDHMLRNDSWKEKNVIAELAKRLGVKLISEKRNVPNFLKLNPNYSIEEAARVVRYRYFLEKFEELKGDKIALAHHRDDRIENFFLMLFRGSGIHGLSSMRVKNFPFIRPLMFTDKSEITKYVEENSIPYIEDYTNYNIDFQRNKLRLIFLPFIRERICKDIDKKIIRTVQILEEYSEFVEEYSEGLFNILNLHEDQNMIVLDYSKLVKEHPVVISEILRMTFEKLKGDTKGLNFEKISKTIELIKIKKVKNFEYNLGSSIRIFKSYDRLFFLKNYNLTLKGFNYKIDREGIYNIEEADTILELKVLNKFDFDKLRLSKEVVIFDCDKIKWPIFIRNRKAGDRIKPIGLKGHKKVKKVLNEMRIPRWLRNKVLVLQDSSGKIMWISGFRISEDFKVTQDTKRFLLLRIMRGGIFDNYEFKR